MSGERWYVTGLILCLLVLSLVILGFRWSVLAARVPIKPLGTDLAVQAQPAQASESAKEGGRQAESGSPSRRAFGKLDLNQATLEQLIELPGIGPVLAERIVTYRERHGAFADVDSLLDVEGIGEGKLKAVRELICAKPID